MRIVNSDIVSASCFNTMDGKDVNGGPVPVTDLKFSPTSNDATNSNGILSPPTTPSTATPSENDYNPTASNSGRFKFYKDGKFILELWHQKNGERMFWIPVSKNSTCWPPVGHCTPRQESSTSLSVSDDNSSVQSSPWQRDHCWKQTVPRKNINRELEFMMHVLRPRKMRFSSSLAAIRKRRRRPYDTIKVDTFAKRTAATSVEDADVEPSKMDAKPSTETLLQHQLEYVGRKARTRRKLQDVVQKLLERRPYECAVSACRTDPGIVSPRKRILKEMEKVSLEEMGNANKKHRARTVFSNTPCSTVTVISGAAGTSTVSAAYGHPVAASLQHASSITATNATTLASGITSAISSASTTTTKSTNSHSISSILSRDEEPSFLRNLLKSPTEGGGGGSAAGDSLSLPVSGDARVTRPAHCSTPVSSPTLSSPPYPSSKSGLPCPPPPPPPAPVPAFIPPAYLYHNAQPFLASPPVSNHPPYYSAFQPNSSVWPVPSISSLNRQSVYPSAGLLSYPTLNPSPWVPVAHSSLQSYPVSENGTDVPLNLSKH